MFGHANPVAIAAVGAVALGVHLFVVFYEEPTLRKKLGADYEEYCRTSVAGGRVCEAWAGHNDPQAPGTLFPLRMFTQGESLTDAKCRAILVDLPTIASYHSSQ